MAELDDEDMQWDGEYPGGEVNLYYCLLLLLYRLTVSSYLQKIGGGV